METGEGLMSNNAVRKVILENTLVNRLNKIPHGRYACEPVHFSYKLTQIPSM